MKISARYSGRKGILLAALIGLSIGMFLTVGSISAMDDQVGTSTCKKVGSNCEGSCTGGGFNCEEMSSGRCRCIKYDSVVGNGPNEVLEGASNIKRQYTGGVQVLAPTDTDNDVQDIEIQMARQAPLFRPSRIFGLGGLGAAECSCSCVRKGLLMCTCGCGSECASCCDTACAGL